jgi:tripartite-type tricarboxylate transporter receptor subunit TctC
VALVASVLAAGAVGAQGFPAKPVRIITGGTGTFHDVVTRQLGHKLSERWAQTVIVENRPAAALTVGTGLAARALPDGYTLLMSDRSALTVAPHLYKNLPYDVATDFVPISLTALAPTLLVAHSSVPATTLPDFLAYAKRQPQAIQFATAGIGTNNHIALELFRYATGIDVQAVHYKGGGASSLALVGGEVKAGFALVPSALPHVRSGKLRAYVVTGRHRFPGTPDLPTAAEAGLPGFELEFWIGMLAPARTPPAVVDKIHRDIVETLRVPALQATLLAQGATAAPGSADEFSAFMRRESDSMKRLIERTGMRAE